MYIFKAGVVGAGFMGAEIAQVISFSGLPVVVKDVDPDMLDKAEAIIRGIYQRRVDKGKMSQSELMDKMDLIEFTLDYDEFEDVDIVVEAVPEVLRLKQDVFRELDEACHDGAIFVSNTSALPIAEMAQATGRPDKVAGLHFFSPAHVMKLVEVIRSPSSSQETVETVQQFAQDLRKIPVIVKDCPGFLVNRLLACYLGEAMLVLQEGAATAAEIDDAMVEFGMPMGPLTLLDFMGLDVSADVGNFLASQYGERFPRPEILQMLVESGRLGEKSGAGFYGYGDQTDQAVKEMIAQIQAKGLAKGEFSDERLIFPMINEAARIAEEEVAAVPDIDLAMIAGTGMTYHGERMGPLAIADEIGLDVVVEGLERFMRAPWGRERFRPAELIRAKVNAGDLGKKSGAGFLEHFNFGW